MNTMIFFLPYMEYQITLAYRSLYCIDVQVFRGKLVKFIHKLLSSSPGFSTTFMSVYIYFDFEYHRTAVSQVSKSHSCISVKVDLFRCPAGDQKLACVASVSSRGSSRKLGQEQKKMNLFFQPFFCFRSNFRAITRLETLATQANRYQINRLFQQDQKRVYQQMNGTSSNFSEVRPDAEETQQFWRDIWGKEVLHNENTEWFKEFKKERVEARQEDIVITALCRMCGSKGETIAHVVSECGKLAQTDYKGRHDNVARYIHWQLCGKC